jgi:hypothetical protein
MQMDQPAKGEFLRISIAHITQADVDKLRNHMWTSCFPGGFFHFVGIDEGDQEWRQHGYGEEFIKIRRWAATVARVSYIQFSINGPCYNELKLFPR